MATIEQVRQLAEYLEGTSGTIDEACGLLDIECDDMLYLQARVAEEGQIDVCTACGWWLPVEELGTHESELYCNDCW